MSRVTPKSAQGFVLQILGDAGDAVTLLYGVAGDGKVAAVEADEGDVGAVQGGDERQLAARGEHLPGQQCADRVGDGIVHVEQIKLVEISHFRHARGQRQIVGRELEQRVVGDRNLVIEDAAVAPIQPEGLRVGDEVHLMAEGSQLDAEFGGDNTRAAVGGITRDADTHMDILVGAGCVRERRPR